jgi:hypothetical protein
MRNAIIVTVSGVAAYFVCQGIYDYVSNKVADARFADSSEVICWTGAITVVNTWSDGPVRNENGVLVFRDKETQRMVRVSAPCTVVD